MVAACAAFPRFSVFVIDRAFTYATGISISGEASALKKAIRSGFSTADTIFVHLLQSDRQNNR